MTRTKPVIDFTLNNNKPGRGRSREKPYDEFALVEATDAQYKDNQALTPKYSLHIATESDPAPEKARLQGQTDKAEISSKIEWQHPQLPRKPPPAPIDRPVLATLHSTPRMGAPKTLRIQFTSLEAITQATSLDVTTDTYLAEVLDTVCRKWKLDKTYHILKVTGTNTVAPVDRIVESMGDRSDLDLVRRRFANDGAIGLSGSPGSSSPNAPLILTPESPRKGKRTMQPIFPPSIRQQDIFGSSAKYKKYNVTRKQPMSFAPSHQRTLFMDEDYLHILPGETGKTLFDSSAKSTRIPFNFITGCKVTRKHPKSFRVSSSSRGCNGWRFRL